MPNCRTLPPLRSIAAGITSRRSMMADPPITSTMPAPPASAPWMTSPKAAGSCGARRSTASLAPIAASRRLVTATVLSSSAGFMAASSVWINATLRGRNGWKDSTGFWRAIARQASSAARFTANGMILTVAAIWSGSIAA